MDPLSDALDVFELTLTSSTRFEAAGSWALAFDWHDQIKVGAVLTGTCWMAAGDGDPMPLSAGDCWLLVGGPSFTIGSDPSVPPVPQAEALPSPWASTMHYEPDADGPRTVIVSGSLSLNRDATELLVAALPALTRICGDDTVRPILELLNGESAVDLPGGTAMRRHLAHVLFLHTLRLVYGSQGRGWLAALTDPSIGRALRGIHRDPGRRWSVAELAREARMSRSSFASRFYEEVGMPPAEYASRWRLNVAAHTLRTTDHRIAEIASSLGFASPSALSAAFTRRAGCSPAQYRSAHRT